MHLVRGNSFKSYISFIVVIQHTIIISKTKREQLQYNLDPMSRTIKKRV